MNENRWKYNTDEYLLRVMKAIKNGMTEPWEYRERFGKRTSMHLLIERNYVNYKKNTGYTITPEGEAWLLGKLNEYTKAKSNM